MLTTIEKGNCRKYAGIIERKVWKQWGLTMMGFRREHAQKWGVN